MSPPTPIWSGVILAGGRSTRMGHDKAGLIWRGQPLLARMSELLAVAGAAQIWVCGRDADMMNGSVYRSMYGARGVALADDPPGLGPLGGLATLARQAPDGELLVVPVDMPCLTLPILRALREAPSAACVSYADAVLPMRLRLDANSRAALACALRATNPGERSLRALHAALGGISLRVNAEARAALASANTPEAWQELVHGHED